MKGTGCKVMILTTFARSGYFERAIKSGASGYLLKDSPSEELADSIRSIMAGRRIYAAELVDDTYGHGNPLTEREKEVLLLIADGKKIRRISQASCILRTEPSAIIYPLSSISSVSATGSKPLQGLKRRVGSSNYEPD